MSRLLKTMLYVAPLCLISSGAFAQASEVKGPVKPIIVPAVKAAAAPTLDGNASDEVWKKAPVVPFEAVKGVHFADNKGVTHGTIQAAYAGDTLYMLLTYDDPTYSVRRSPYQKQPDGSWIKVKDPEDKGGDNNLAYEDKFALLWNINASIFGFNEKLGCNALCHAGEPGKAYGNKYTTDPGELGDIWHMKFVRTGHFGQIDDQYVDDTRFDPQKSPEAGRKSDPSTGGGYEDVKLVNGKPEFMNKDGLAANKGGTYWIDAANKVPFDDSKFQPGDEVASIVTAPFTGDRADIKVAVAWKDGKWTAEFSRKLVTGSQFDVQFDDLSKVYGFGIALFDNAQVRHAYTQPPLHLVFQK
jgi:hypothetical protein